MAYAIPDDAMAVLSEIGTVKANEIIERVKRNIQAAHDVSVEFMFREVVITNCPDPFSETESQKIISRIKRLPPMPD